MRDLPLNARRKSSRKTFGTTVGHSAGMRDNPAECGTYFHPTLRKIQCLVYIYRFIII